MTAVIRDEFVPSGGIFHDSTSDSVEACVLKAEFPDQPWLQCRDEPSWLFFV